MPFPIADRPRATPRLQESEPVAPRDRLGELEALTGVRVATMSRGDFVKFAERLLTQPLARDQASPMNALMRAAEAKGIPVNERERLLIASLEARLPRFLGLSSRASSVSEELEAASAVYELLNLGSKSAVEYVGKVLEQNAKAYSRQRMADGGVPRTILLSMLDGISNLAVDPQSETLRELAPSLEAATQSVLRNAPDSEWAQQLAVLAARARSSANRGWLPSR